jgi:DNA-directed RNA polymerase specialized sigma24 family protein
VFYFKHKTHPGEAEDLAHDTIETFLRTDFQFRSKKDFLKVCYGFAHNILLAHYRKQGRRRTVELDWDVAAEETNVLGLTQVEMDTLLRQTYEAAEKLSDRDREILEIGLEDGEESKGNTFRVAFHRMGRRLKKIINPGEECND